MNIQSAKEYIKSITATNKEKSKKFGEVFTPFELIEEMLDQLPVEVRTDSNKTRLDPAAGYGNFHLIVLERLMTGLSEIEPNEAKRLEHIITKQLYFCELQETSCAVIESLFNPDKKYKLNLFCGSFLSAEFDEWRESL